MCGIAGFLGNGSKDVLVKMQNRLKHRGPDSLGLYFNKSFGFTQTRLKIIDLSDNANQPMWDSSNNFGIVFNGEIYNYVEIKRDLEAKGYKFRTNSDTEVLLLGYIEYGEEILSKLSGMFAFSIWNKKNNELFVAVDHFGIKPLYYYYDKKNFVYASEIKSILEHDCIKKEIDFDAINFSLSLMYLPPPMTGYKGIYKLEAGYYLKLTSDSFMKKRYYDIPVYEKRLNFENEAIELLDNAMINSIKRHLVADVEVGVLLSGGLDSSLILALNSIYNSKIKTFTIRFEEDDVKKEGIVDDSVYARKMADYFSTEHTEILIKPDILDLFDKILYHLDEPIADPAAINTYLISKAARQKGIIVLLNGMGADEIFAGYPKHYALLKNRFITKNLPKSSINLIKKFSEFIPVSTGGRSIKSFRRIKKGLNALSHDGLDNFLTLSSYQRFNQLKELIKPDFVMKEDKIFNLFEEHYKNREDSFLNRFLYLDIKTFLQGLNLLYSDKMTMMASVEARPPFVDKEVVETAFFIEDDLKIRGRNQKYILKKLSEKYIPDEIIYRKKAPFSAPLRKWINYELKDYIIEILTGSRIENSIFNSSYVEKIVNDNFSGKSDNSHLIYSILTVLRFLEKF